MRVSLSARRPGSAISLVGLVAVLAACGSAAPATRPSATSMSSAAAATSAATIAPSPTAAATVDMTNWVAFESKVYGFSVSHPAGWTVAAGSGHWSLTNYADATADILTSPSGPPSPVGPPSFGAIEVKVPLGTTVDAFLQAITNLGHGPQDCYPFGTQLPKTTIDGHAATIAYGGCVSQYYYAEAVAVIGNRVWIFGLHGPDRSLILPFLSTVKIDPTKVVD